VIIAQLAPAFFGAIFWRRGSRLGAIYGIFNRIYYLLLHLLIPYAIGFNQSVKVLLFKEGFMKIGLLKPFQLFGLDYLQPVPHALFWSMLFNGLTYISRFL
jgi:Na+/proline symporter